MNKDLTYYMKLEYKREITPIPKSKGGGFEASIPQLGSYAFVGQGETAEEALKDLEVTKKENFEEYIEKGIEIPEPEEAEREFRGDFLLRMPMYLHRDLYYAAKENEISLNQYMNYLLTKTMTLDSLEKKIDELSAKVNEISEKVSRFPRADIAEWETPYTRTTVLSTSSGEVYGTICGAGAYVYGSFQWAEACKAILQKQSHVGPVIAAE